LINKFILEIVYPKNLREVSPKRHNCQVNN
jgi:hypothetical protein